MRNKKMTTTARRSSAATKKPSMKKRSTPMSKSYAAGKISMEGGGKF